MRRLWSIPQPSQNKKGNARRQRTRGRKSVCNCSRGDDLDTGYELPINALPELTNETTKKTNCAPNKQTCLAQCHLFYIHVRLPIPGMMLLTPLHHRCLADNPCSAQLNPTHLSSPLPLAKAELSYLCYLARSSKNHSFEKARAILQQESFINSSPPPPQSFPFPKPASRHHTTTKSLHSLFSNYLSSSEYSYSIAGKRCFHPVSISQ